MELRPRKDRSLSSSKPPPPSPMSGRATIQYRSARASSASLSSQSKAARAQKFSSSIGPRTMICLSSDEDNQKSENALLEKMDADVAPAQNASRSGALRSPITVSSTGGNMKKMSADHKTNGNDATPQSRLTGKGRLRGSTRKMVPKVSEEVDTNGIVSRVGQEDTSTRPEAADAIEPESKSMEIIKTSVSKHDSKSRKRTPSMSISEKRQEINRKLFENVLDGEMDAKDTNCRTIELSHQNMDEKGQTTIGETQGNYPRATFLIANGLKEKSHKIPENLTTSGVEEITNLINSDTSTLATIPIANEHQENSNISPANLANVSAEAERTTLIHMLPDRHWYQTADEKEPGCKGYEDEVAKARSLDEKEELTAEIKQFSCANLRESILGEEQSEQGNGGSIQCESYGGIGSGFEQEADMSPDKGPKERNAALRQIIEQKAQEHLDNNCDKFFCTKSGEKNYCHRENNQELSLDDNAKFCKFKGDGGEKEAENHGFASSGKKEIASVDSLECHGIAIVTDIDIDNDTEQDENEADGTTFQGSSSDWKIKRKDEDSNDDDDDNGDEDEDEDEEELAKLFVKSLKAHLRQASDQSDFVNMQKDVAAKVGQCEEEENEFRKVASKEVEKKSSNRSRLPISWFPETGLQVTKTDKCPGRDCIGTVKGVPETIWQKEGKLIDRLLVPPVDPHKLNKLSRKQTKDTAGAKWYGLSAPTITPELKKELQLLKLRNVIDPKRHYKSADSKGLPKYFQVGTVVGGPADFYSGRLTKKERKNTFADELLSDSTLSNYRKRKYTEIQEQKQAGGKKFWKKNKSKRTPSWART